MYKPNNLKLWKHPESYFGPTWEGHYSTGFGQSRDSDCLERSNFRMAWKAISAVSEEAQIVRENHWAVGWVEWIVIPEGDSIALRTADGLRDDYAQYPVLSDEDLSELEQEEANEVWANCYRAKERLEYIRNHDGQFEFRSLADLIGCVRGKYFAGVPSELLE